MQVAGRTKVDDEDGDGDAIDIGSDSGLLGIQCVFLGRYAAPGDLDPYKKER